MRDERNKEDGGVGGVREMVKGGGSRSGKELCSLVSRVRNTKGLDDNYTVAEVMVQREVVGEEVEEGRRRKDTKSR